jgi:uncharacterized protein (DUF2141 family)
MKKFVLITIIMISFSLSYTLDVQINNVKLERGGSMSIAVHNSQDTFPSAEDKEKYFTYQRYPVATQNNTSFDIPEGQYSITVFQDTNDNFKIDKNFIGLPTEPYGISNDSTDGFGRPIYKTSVIEVSKDMKTIINLR